MITQKEIAKRLGISRTTVARALKENSSIKEETRQKVLALMQETQYEKNFLGSSLAGRGKSIHAFLIESKNPHYSQESKRALLDLQEEYKKYRIQFVFHQHAIHAGEAQYEEVKSLLESEEKIDALLVIPLEAEKLQALLEGKSAFPILALSRDLGEKISHVGSDYYEEGRLAANILSSCLREGEKVLVLDHGDDKISTLPYLQGFLSWMAKEKQEVLGPYVCKDWEESLSLIEDFQKEEGMAGIFTNRYATEIFGAASKESLERRKVVISGMGPMIPKLLEEGKIVASLEEQIYEQARFAGKWLVRSMYQERWEILRKHMASRIIYLEHYLKK